MTVWQLIKRRPLRSTIAMVGFGVVMLAGPAAHVAGVAYIKSIESETQRQAAAINAMVVSTPRKVDAESAIDDDSGVWYARAFAAMPDLSADTVLQLAALSSPVSSSVETSVYNEVCTKPWRFAIEQALRSSRSTWIPLKINELPALNILRKRIATGHCLLAQRVEKDDVDDARERTRASLEAFAYSHDLARGDLPMRIAAAGLGRSALTQLREILRVRGRAQVALDSASRQLPLLGPPPEFLVALQSEEIFLRGFLAQEAKEWVSDRRRSFPVLPWTAVASWRLSSFIEELDDFDTLAGSRTAHDRQSDPGGQLAERWKASGSEVLRRERVQDLYRAAAVAKEVTLLYWALMSAVDAEQWRAAHGLYPPSGTLLNARPDNHGLRYQSLDGGRAFTLIALRPPSGDTPIVERGVVF